MTLPAPGVPPFATFDDFAAWESQQEGRYEYANGHAVAMSGASPRHNLLASRIGRLIGGQVLDGCQMLSEGQRIAKPDGTWFYADGSLVCGRPLLALKTHALENPRALIEVLSRSSFDHDHGEKWQSYQKLESLVDYLIVSQWEPRIEHYQRIEGGWTYRIFIAGETVPLLDIRGLAVDEVYDSAFDFPCDDDLA